MKRRTQLIIAGIILLGIFALFSRVVKQGRLRNADFAVSTKIQEKIDTSTHLRFADAIGNVMEGATFFASPEFSSVVVLGITAWAFIDRKKKRIRWTALVIPAAFFLIVAGELYGKTVVHHPSPPFYMIKNPTTLFPKNYINEQFSYPSGHTARAVFIALVVLFFAVKQWNKAIQKKKVLMVGAGMAGYVMLVAVSRMYLGHHWFSDVLGGLFLGGAAATAAEAVLAPGPPAIRSGHT